MLSFFNFLFVFIFEFLTIPQIGLNIIKHRLGNPYYTKLSLSAEDYNSYFHNRSMHLCNQI